MMDIQLELDADTSQALERCNTEQNPPCPTLARRPEVQGSLEEYSHRSRRNCSSRRGCGV